MGKCLIFCAAGFRGLIEPIQPDDCILAADGGLAHVESLGLAPHETLGDFDSLGYTPDRARVFPVEKDDTDSMLAIRRGLELGYRDFVLYGSLDGDRLDHTVANFQALQFLADHGASGLLVGQTWLVRVIKNGCLEFPAGQKGVISVFCLGPQARGVDIQGLRYELTDGALSAGFPLGVSNHFIGKASRITVREGSLLILWQRNL